MSRIKKSGKKEQENKNGKSKKKLTKKQKIIIALSIILGIFLIIGIIFATYIYKADGDIANAALNIMADVVGDETPTTVLVLGVSEGIETPLTDTMLLAGYNPKTQNAFMISIPRDTYIGTNDNYADGYSKINSLYQKGVDKTVAQVEKITGVKIEHYVVVKTSALVQIVDAIGGVEFNVPIDMKYDDPTQNLHIDLKAGTQIIDGPKAEQLLRFRHSNPDKNGRMTTYPASYGTDDFGRMRTQREFIMATMKQMIQWKNLGKIKDITSAIFDNLETDLTLKQMIGYIPTVLKFDTNNLKMQQLPGESEKINGLWFYSHSLTKTKTLVTECMEALGLEEAKLNELYTPISTTSKRIKKTEPEDDTETDITGERPPVVEEEETSKNTNTDDKNNSNNNNSSNNNSNNNSNNSNNNQPCAHNWQEVKIIKPATCKETGSREMICTKCKNTLTDTIPKTDSHTWGGPVTIKEPTEAETGTKRYTCTECGQTKDEVIDKLQQTTPPNPDDGGQKQPTNPEESGGGTTGSETEGDSGVAEPQPQS